MLFRGNPPPANRNLILKLTFATADREILAVWPFGVMFVTGPEAVSHPLPPKAGGINPSRPVPRHGAVAQRDAASAGMPGLVGARICSDAAEWRIGAKTLPAAPPPPSTQDPQLIQSLSTRATWPAERKGRGGPIFLRDSSETQRSSAC